MNIVRLHTNERLYSSNVYLAMGDWKRIEDVNTLIDVGSDPGIVDRIDTLNTGIGKRKIEQVILTHCHSDHTAALAAVKKAYAPRVFAFSPHLDGVDRVVKHGDRLRVGDRLCDILHFPAHSEDSILIHNAQDGDLFVGDTPIVIQADGSTYDERFLRNIDSLCRKNIKAIYFGHGEPLLAGAKQAVLLSLQILRKTQKQAPPCLLETVPSANGKPSMHIKSKEVYQ